MEEKISEKYPKGASYILWNMFFDRFSAGGFFSILAIYLNQQLLFDKNISTAIYHFNEFLLYVFAICGGIIADSFLGKYKTVFYMTLIYIIGAAVMTIASIKFEFLSIRIGSFVGMLAIMIGTGGVKSCQNALAGDLFKLPEQAAKLDDFFSLQFIALKLGQVSGMTLLPILYSDVPCNTQKDCYPLAYGVATLLMILSLTVVWLGRKSYVHNIPSNNVIVEVLRCIFFALKSKIVSSESKKSHWLDHSEQRFGSQLVKDTKKILSILVMYLPLFIFWALLNQQMSRWVFQASLMNGDLGWYTLKSDQIIVVGPFLILILLPLFNKYVFPILEKCGLKTPLKKIGIGMFLAGMTFLCSAYVEYKIHQNYISIMWLIPQYLLAALSEVFLWVSNVSFAYKEAPKSMKSVVSAMVYLSIAGGALIIFFISGVKVFKSQVNEFLFFATLMFLDTAIFVVLAVKYKYSENETVVISRT